MTAKNYQDGQRNVGEACGMSEPTFAVAEAEPHEVVDGRDPVRKHLAGLQFARCEDVLLHALNC
jgi:hypothetical protein